jgi:large subunit ribosomal protein L7Ae
MGKKVKKGTIYTQSKLKKLSEKHPLCQPEKRNFRLGNHVRPSIVKSRFVKWPRYVQIQRKKRVLLRRLKVPAVLAQFFNPLDKSTTNQLVKLLQKYSPETRQQKTDRIQQKAKDQAQNNKEADSTKPTSIKFGLNHVTYLIEQKKAKLVVIANDVDPIENVVFLPTLCKTMDIPYCIVSNKSRLGQLVHQKTATCVALTEFKTGQSELNNIARICREQFNSAVPVMRKPEQGCKTAIRERKLQKLLLIEQAKKGTS